MSSIANNYRQSPASLIGGTKAWLVCFAGALFFFYEFIQMHMFNAINEALRQVFAVNATELSFLSSTYLLADLIFLLPAGILLDRFSTRKTILAAVFVCIIGTLGFAISSQFWWAAFFHFLSGIGNAFCFLSCIMLVSRWFPANRQALVIGLVVTMAFLGGVAAQTPLAYISQLVGWRQALILDALLGVLIMAFIFWQVEDGPDGHRISLHTSKKHFLDDLFSVIKNKQNWLLGTYTCLLNLPIMVLCAVWGKEYLVTVHHFSLTQATNATSLIFFGSIVGSPLAGFCSDWLLSRKKPMLLGAMISLTLVSLIMFPIHWNYNGVALIFFLIGLFTSTQVIAYPFVAESNPPRLTGTATGLASLIIMGGAGLAQVLYGALLDWHWDGTLLEHARVYSAENYHFAMWMFPIAFIISLIAVALSKESKCQNPYKDADYESPNHSRLKG